MQLIDIFGNIVYCVCVEGAEMIHYVDVVQTGCIGGGSQQAEVNAQIRERERTINDCSLNIFFCFSWFNTVICKITYSNPQLSDK